MDTETGATAVMAETRAEHYYRRSGFNGVATRDRPGIRREKDFVPVREWDLEEGRAYDLTVYPELTVREKPWKFWGRVEKFDKDSLILTLMTGDNRGTPATIPYRYFQDGRVWKWQIVEEK